MYSKTTGQIKNETTKYEKTCDNISQKLNNQLNVVNYEIDWPTSIHKEEECIDQVDSMSEAFFLMGEHFLEKLSKMEL